MRWGRAIPKILPSYGIVSWVIDAPDRLRRQLRPRGGDPFIYFRVMRAHRCTAIATGLQNSDGFSSVKRKKEDVLSVGRTNGDAPVHGGGVVLCYVFPRHSVEFNDANCIGRGSLVLQYTRVSVSEEKH